MPRILVTGGCGYIGVHTLVDLIEHGYEVVSIDDNSRSTEAILDNAARITGITVKNYRVNLCDRKATIRAFRDIGPVDGIIHFAAYKIVPESVQQPLQYFYNNLNSLLNVLENMERHRIPSLVFSSSCSVYGNPDRLPVTEDTPWKPAESPYARTKQMNEEMIRDFSKVYPGRFILLRYFNPVGAHPGGLLGQVPLEKPENLVPVITETAIGKRKEMFVHGGDYPTRDGSCIRDYIHVMDIAHAHTLAFEYLQKDSSGAICEVFNLGTGQGVTVLEAIRAFEEATGVKLNYRIGPRRPGDVVAIYAERSKATRQLGWEPQYSLQDMMSSAWKWELYLRDQGIPK